VDDPSPRHTESTAYASATSRAALMMAQTLILALIEKGLLSGNDILEAVESLIEAPRSTVA